ncbi:hypothetical protein MN116_004949 [Schistosoma mekongi]|uniref:Uncharacterized protein n=1 Tax=Schistosoma mekongi TaxID=38744 RepID=A0AAE1ZDL5_SCHME|nr:hypothetical protein MN116_004949 [Schistosoma mekongi]
MPFCDETKFKKLMVLKNTSNKTEKLTDSLNKTKQQVVSKFVSKIKNLVVEHNSLISPDASYLSTDISLLVTVDFICSELEKSYKKLKFNLKKKVHSSRHNERKFQI